MAKRVLSHPSAAIVLLISLCSCILVKGVVLGPHAHSFLNNTWANGSSEEIKNDQVLKTNEKKDLESEKEFDPETFRRLDGVAFVNETGPPILAFYDGIGRRTVLFTEGRQNATRVFRVDPTQLYTASIDLLPEAIHLRGGVADTLGSQTRIYLLASLDNNKSETYIIVIDADTLEIIQQLLIPISNELNPAMVIETNQFIYIGTKSVVTSFFKFQIYPSVALKVRENISGLYNPNCGFIDQDLGSIYFGTFSSPISQIVRVFTSNCTVASTLNLLPGETRLSTVAYDKAAKRAYFGVYERLSCVVIVDILNFQRLMKLEFDPPAQNIFSSYLDSRTNYAYFGTKTAPGVVYRVDTLNPSISTNQVVILPNKEDAINSVAFSPDDGIAIWGCSGFENLDPITKPYSVIVSTSSPIRIAPPSPSPPKPDPGDGSGDSEDSVAAIPVPIFVAALFLSVGAVSIASIVYYRRKVSRNRFISSADQASRKGPSLPVDPQVKQIDYNEIELGSCIGVGGMGEVHRAIWNGTEIAVKKLHMSYQSLNTAACKDIAEEMLLHSSLRHPNIITFLGACVYPPNICICLEYMPRHSLYEVLHAQAGLKLDWKLIIKMGIDAARGLNFLHCSKPMIIHRDLKSHNLLVDQNWTIKVTDFGSARIKQHFAYTMTCIGTPQWMAPEVIRGEHYSERCDVYSFGIVLWEMFTQEDPYKGMNPIQVATAVAFRDLRPPVPLLCPPSYHSLMTECWDSSPKNRPSFKEILKRLAQMTND